MPIGFIAPSSQPRATTRGKAEPAKPAEGPPRKRTGKLSFELNEKHPAGTLYQDGAPIAPSTLVELLAGDVCSLLVSVYYHGRNDVLKAVADATRSKPGTGGASPTTPGQTGDLVTVLRALEQRLAKPRVVDKQIVREQLPGDEPGHPTGRPIGVRETDITQ
jgi:hypothetical protein